MVSISSEYIDSKGCVIYDKDGDAPPKPKTPVSKFRQNERQVDTCSQVYLYKPHSDGLTLTAAILIVPNSTA